MHTSSCLCATGDLQWKTQGKITLKIQRIHELNTSQKKSSQCKTAKQNYTGLVAFYNTARKRGGLNLRCFRSTWGRVDPKIVKSDPKWMNGFVTRTVVVQRDVKLRIECQYFMWVSSVAHCPPRTSAQLGWGLAELWVNRSPSRPTHYILGRNVHDNTASLRLYERMYS